MCFSLSLHIHTHAHTHTRSCVHIHTHTNYLPCQVIDFSQHYLELVTREEYSQRPTKSSDTTKVYGSIKKNEEKMYVKQCRDVLSTLLMCTVHMYCSDPTTSFQYHIKCILVSFISTEGTCTLYLCMHVHTCAFKCMHLLCTCVCIEMPAFSSKLTCVLYLSLCRDSQPSTSRSAYEDIDEKKATTSSSSSRSREVSERKRKPKKHHTDPSDSAASVSKKKKIDSRGTAEASSRHDDDSSLRKRLWVAPNLRVRIVDTAFRGGKFYNTKVRTYFTV